MNDDPMNLYNLHAAPSTLFGYGEVAVVEERTPASAFQDDRVRIYKRVNGILHCDDGPAVITFMRGTFWKAIWYQNGEAHRDDGPAMIESEDRQLWYYHHGEEQGLNGGIGPSRVASTYNVWSIAGHAYREDGPSYIVIYPETGDVVMTWVQEKLDIYGDPEIHRHEEDSDYKVKGKQWFHKGEPCDPPFGWVDIDSVPLEPCETATV